MLSRVHLSELRGTLLVMSSAGAVRKFHDGVFNICDGDVGARGSVPVFWLQGARQWDVLGTEVRRESELRYQGMYGQGNEREIMCMLW